MANDAGIVSSTDGAGDIAAQMSAENTAITAKNTKASRAGDDVEKYQPTPAETSHAASSSIAITSTSAPRPLPRPLLHEGGHTFLLIIGPEQAME